jgi:rSAM/selenodomain-associated transferase 1
MSDGSLLVIAKDPQAGRSKTRLCPPCTPQQAATLAAAALSDTLDVVLQTPARRRVLVLDGAPDRWRRPGLEIIIQRGRDLAERLSNAFADVAEPALLVGMDTPQLRPALLRDGLDALHRYDAVLGSAPDGGYWSVGLRRWHPHAFRGVPMSTPETAAHQRRRFAELGLRVHEQPPLRDVDTIIDAHAVAAETPASRFATALAGIT